MQWCSAAHARASAAASRARLGHGARDAWLATLPLFHVGGLAILARSALEGSTILLEDGFDAARCSHALTYGEATMISLVPTMLSRVLEIFSGAVHEHIRCVLVGGASLAPSLAGRALDAALPIAATYGMSEACSQIATTAPRAADAAAGFVGLPLAGVEVRIDDPGAGGWGEILVRGPNVARGYLRNAEADLAAFRGGWLATGDVGRLDARGALEVLGRRDDLIISGGENISPTEVERVLDEHPRVAESMVFGQDDETWGQRVAAMIVATPGEAPPPAAELTAWCRERIAAFKIPREIRFVPRLPRNATGKLERRAAARRRPLSFE